MPRVLDEGVVIYDRMRLFDGSGFDERMGFILGAPDGLVHAVVSWHGGKTGPSFSLTNLATVIDKQLSAEVWAHVMCEKRIYRATPVGRDVPVTCLACIARTP